MNVQSTVPRRCAQGARVNVELACQYIQGHKVGVASVLFQDLLCAVQQIRFDDSPAAIERAIRLDRDL
jgi:hypothetical protein